MRIGKFKIDIYGWEIGFVEIKSEADLIALSKTLKKNDISEELINDVRKDYANAVDGGSGGLCISNTSKFSSTIIVYKVSTNSRLVELISHEASHAMDDIIELLGLETSGETKAYLSGYIMEQLFILAFPDIARNPRGIQDNTQEST